MAPAEVLDEFRAAGALLEGHFVLSSGLHSSVFLQKMFVFMDPVRTERLCRALAGLIAERFGPIDLVVSPAVGGIVPGYETARHLGARAIFVERENGAFALRRGFAIPAGARAVMVEDIVTTGLSSRECLAAVAGEPGAILGAACLIDRSNGRADFPVPLVALARLTSRIPPRRGAPAGTGGRTHPRLKPGSRAGKLSAMSARTQRLLEPPSSA
jgi:orotate phosphoribosyltransferase